MTVKSLLCVEVTKNDRLYQFYIPAGAPYGETYDAMFACLESITEMQKLSIDQLKNQNPNPVVQQETEPDPIPTR